MTEDGFLRTVLDMARLFGWRAMHIRPAWTKKGWRSPVQGPGSKGFPDLVLLKKEKFLVRELKTDKGKLDADQEAWLKELREAGVDAGVWRPRDWTAIEEELSQ